MTPRIEATHAILISAFEHQDQLEKTSRKLAKAYTATRTFPEGEGSTSFKCGAGVPLIHASRQVASAANAPHPNTTSALRGDYSVQKCSMLTTVVMWP